MPTPTEHKTVQARILEYAEAIGWKFVSQKEAEQRRGFDPETPIKDRAKGRALFFEDLLDAKVREFNPRYAEAEGALPGKVRHLHTDIYGHREFVEGRPLNHRERKERKEDFDGAIWPHAVAMSSCRQFWHRLFQKLVTACRQILEQAVQERIPAPEFP